MEKAKTKKNRGELAIGAVCVVLGILLAVQLRSVKVNSAADAAGAGITDIDQKNGALLLTIPKFDLRQVSALCGGEKYKGRLLFSAGDKPYLSLKLKKGEDALRAARALVADYAAGLG